MAERRVLVAHPSRERYGSDRQCLESVRALVTDGWGVTVALPPRDQHAGGHGGDLGDDMADAGATVITLDAPVLRKAFMTPRGLVRLVVRGGACLPRLVGAVRSAGPDVVYVSTLVTPLWVLAARLAGARVVVHVHEAEGDAAAPVRAALVAPLALARVVVANSAASLAVLVDSAPSRPRRVRRALAARTTVVHNGVPAPAPTATSAARPRLDGPVALVLVGRLSPRKGSDTAVEALAQLTASGVDATLTLVGDAFEHYAWFEESLRAHVHEAGLEGRVTFAGLAASPWPALASADVALVPSRVEPFGNIAVEAMLAGRPVVASRTQGLAEVVRDGVDGHLVDPGDPGELAAAVRAIVAGWPAALARADLAQRAARERFSTDAYAAGLLSAMDVAARR